MPLLYVHCHLIENYITSFPLRFSYVYLFVSCEVFIFIFFIPAVEYTTKLQRERHTMQEEAELLRKQIQELNASIRFVVISL